MAKRPKIFHLHGWINLDKAYGQGSTQAVAAVRRLLGGAKTGHAGTLDPLASGVLPIAVGEATKTISVLQDADKEYLFTVRWGEQRRTDDAEGTVIASSEHRPTAAAIADLLPRFIGLISQIPPQFSAIKLAGERAYDLARDGEEVALAARPVLVKNLSLLAHEGDSSQFRLHCGKGTYVRALARDMGLALGCYGYVAALRRERVGNFLAKDAISLDFLGEMALNATADKALRPVGAVLDDIPALAVTETEARALRHGQSLSFLSRADWQRVQDSGFDQLADDQPGCAWLGDLPLGLVCYHAGEIRVKRLFNL